MRQVLDRSYSVRRIEQRGWLKSDEVAAWSILEILGAVGHRSVGFLGFGSIAVVITLGYRAQTTPGEGADVRFSDNGQNLDN